jgi:hypothetical protein
MTYEQVRVLEQEQWPESGYKMSSAFADDAESEPVVAVTMCDIDRSQVLAGGGDPVGEGVALIAASSPIAAGAVAPAFVLAAAPDRKVALSDFVSQTVILVFYPADWSPVCTDQLALYNELLPLFEEHRAQVLGISVDGVWSHIDGAGIVRWSYVSPSGVNPGADGILRALEALAGPAVAS